MKSAVFLLALTCATCLALQNRETATVWDGVYTADPSVSCRWRSKSRDGA